MKYYKIFNNETESKYGFGKLVLDDPESFIFYDQNTVLSKLDARSTSIREVIISNDVQHFGCGDGGYFSPVVTLGVKRALSLPTIRLLVEHCDEDSNDIVHAGDENLLRWAIIADKSHIARYVMRYNPDVNINNGEFLNRAVRHQNATMVRLLLNNGVDPSLANFKAVYTAMYISNSEITDLLFRSLMNDTTDKHIPIYEFIKYVIEINNLSMFRLITTTFNLYKIDLIDCHDIMVSAAREDNSIMIDHLLKICPENFAPFIDDAFVAAMASGSKDTIKLLIRKGVKLSTCTGLKNKMLYLKYKLFGKKKG